MKCLFLAGKYSKSCSAGREVYVPSTFEIEEYCANSRYIMCPLYAERLSELPGKQAGYGFCRKLMVGDPVRRSRASKLTWSDPETVKKNGRI